MSDYTPTTEEVRQFWTVFLSHDGDEFNRWLAAHDAEVCADEREKWIKRMEEHADSCDYGDEDGDCMGYEDCGHFLPSIYYHMKSQRDLAAIRGNGEPA